jgi:phage/plasmid-associated DNA primase
MDTNNYFKDVNDDRIFEDNILTDLIMDSLDKDYYKIANVIFYIFKDKYACANNKQWYIFENHIWRQLQSIEIHISREIPKYYKKLLIHCDNDNKKAIDRICMILIERTNRNKIINILSTFLCDHHEIEDKLNQNTDLIAFTNGIIDLNSMIFRDGTPADYISMSVGYAYTDTYSEHRNDILKFFEDILPDKKTRHILLSYLSSGLSGDKQNESFVTFIGKVCNGKSSVRRLMECTLGDYCKTIGGEIFNNNNFSHYDAILFKNKRFIFGEDLYSKKTINTSFVKKLIKNKGFFYQGKKKQQIYISLPCTIALICTNNPEFDYNDKCVLSNHHDIQFPIKFIIDEHVISNMQKHRDYDIYNNLNKWKQDFMLILLEYRNLCKTLNTTIFNRSDDYMDNIYLTYINDKLEVSSKHIKSSDVHCDFIKWISVHHPEEIKPSKTKFNKNIENYITRKKVRIGTNSEWGFENIKIKQSSTNKRTINPIKQPSFEIKLNESLIKIPKNNVILDDNDIKSTQHQFELNKQSIKIPENNDITTIKIQKKKIILDDEYSDEIDLFSHDVFKLQYEKTKVIVENNINFDDKLQIDNKNIKNNINKKTNKCRDKKQKIKRKPIPKKLKTLSWNKYIGEEAGISKCLCCKVTKISQSNFHCGHVISHNNGGGITVTNLRPICAECNLSMSSKNMDKFMEDHGFGELIH